MMGKVMAMALDKEQAAPARTLLADQARRWKGRVLTRWHTAWRPHMLYLRRGERGPEDVQSAIDAFARWCVAHEGAVCRLGLSSRWTLSLVSQPGLASGARTQARAQAMKDEAARQWAHYHDVDDAALASDWIYRQTRSWHASLACAAPRVLIEGLLKQAGLHGVGLTSVSPWWVHAVQAWMGMAESLGGEALVSGERGDQSVARSAEQPTEQPAGQAAELRLVEPGLVTHVQIGKGAGRSLQLLSVWSEATESHGPCEANPHRLVLPMPTDAGEHEAALLWDHASMAPVLSGHIKAWQGKA